MMPASDDLKKLSEGDDRRRPSFSGLQSSRRLLWHPGNAVMGPAAMRWWDHA